MRCMHTVRLLDICGLCWWFCLLAWFICGIEFYMYLWIYMYWAPLDGLGSLPPCWIVIPCTSSRAGMYQCICCPSMSTNGSVYRASSYQSTLISYIMWIGIMFLLNVGLSLTHTPSQMEMISQWNIKYDYLSMFWHQSEHLSKKGSYVLNPSLFLIYGIYLRTISNTQPSHEIVRYRLINTAYRNPLELNIFRELLDLIIKGMRKYISYWERQSAVYIHKYCFFILKMYK